MSARKTFPILVIFTMLVGLLGFAMPAFAAAGDIVVSYTLPSGTVNAGDNITIPVLLANNSVEPLTGLQFNLSWNPAVLDLTSVTKGTYFTTCSLATSDFLNAPTISHAAGTMTNYSVAGLGIPGGQGCYNTGTGSNTTTNNIATLNFHAVANGKSTVTVSGVIFSDVNSHAYAANNYTFPGFTQYVGQAPRLVVQSVAFQPNGGTPPGSIFNAIVTVANQGGSASDPDTLVVTTDGNATPASTNVPLAAIPANTTQQFTVAMAMVAGQQSAKVTASIASFSTSVYNTYSPVSSSGSTAIDATFGAFILITPDTAVNFGSLALGANSASGNMNVKCNTSYEVDVTDNAGNAWNMAEWNGTAFVASGHKLASKLTVTAAGNPAATEGHAMLLTGGVAGQGANNAGQNFALTYAQSLTYGDALLPAGETYHIILTWNGFVTA